MATTKKAAETAAVEYSTMNVFKKLQLARVRFLEAGVDKSGKHMKLEYKYFELADIVPKAEQIFLEIGLMMVPSMYGDKATARVYNVDDREDFIDFVAPYTPIAPIVSNAGNQVTNEMQATGSSITFAVTCGSSFLTLWSMTVSTAASLTRLPPPLPLSRRSPL